MPSRGQPGSDHGPLALVEVSPVQVLADNETRQAALAVPRAELRLDPGLRAPRITVATIDDLSVIEPDRLTESVRRDVCDEFVERRATHERKELRNGMEFRWGHSPTCS